MIWGSNFHKASGISFNILRYSVGEFICKSIKCQTPEHELAFKIWTPYRCHSSSAGTGNKHNFHSLSHSVLLGILAMPVFCLLGWHQYKAKILNSHKLKDTVLHRDKYCNGNSGTLIKMGKYWLPFEFFKEKNKLKDVKEFHVHDSDVIIVSFPKSGTTWIQEIVHQLSDGLSESEELTIEEIFPYIEYVYPGLKHLAKCTSPRYMKTHLPYELLPDDVYTGHGKVIYIARNVKDVSVSYFHFIKMLTITKYSGEFNDFLTTFVDGKVAYGPWTDHVLGYWKQREQSNILFISYEDLHKNPVVVIKQISSFLGKSVDEKQMLEIAFQCSFSQMKSNPLVNYSWWHDLGISDKKQTDFMRKGKVGDWMNYYTEDMLKKINVCCIEPAEKEQLILKDNL